MAGFPRGWTITAQALNGGQAILTVPAVAGVAHVLTGFSARLLSYISSNVALGVGLQVALGIDPPIPFPALLVTGGFSTDDQSQTGLELATRAGDAIIISFLAACPAGYDEFIVAQGYDI